MGMIGSEGLLPDLQSALIEWLRLGEATLAIVKQGEYCNLNPEPSRTAVAYRAPLIFSAKIIGDQSYVARYGHQ